MRYYLEQIVFPEVTAHQATKLSANGQDLGGEMLFGTRIGFSGTPSSLLPLEMGDCVYAQGDDGKMLRALTETLGGVSIVNLGNEGRWTDWWRSLIAC